MIKIIIIDDHEIVLLGLRLLFEQHKDFTVCATCTTISQSHDIIGFHRPHVVLIDMKLPDGDGISAGQHIKQNFPSIKVVLLTAFESNTLKLEATRANFDGFLLKSIHSNELVQSIRNIVYSVDTDTPYFSESILQPVSKLTVKDSLNLSAQQIRILSLVALGKTNHEISDELNCSEKTIRNQLTTIYQNINVSNRSEAIIFWIRYQMVD